MGKERLLAFSDGVIAIIITIMVLELKVPHGTDWDVLTKLLPVFLSYVMSFVYVAIYWNNHHHMLHLATGVTGNILWANMHLLFWLSLFPFAAGWLGENHFGRQPTILYGTVLLAAGVAYKILARSIVRHQGANGPLKQAVGSDNKGDISLALYALGIVLAFVSPIVANLVFAGVALMWLIPDRRIEQHVIRSGHKD